MQNPIDRLASSSQQQQTLSNMALALSYVDEAIVWTDGDKRIQWCNAAFERLLDQTANVLAAQSLTQLLPLTCKDEPLPLSLHPANWVAGQQCESQYGFQRRDRSFTLALTVTPLPGSETVPATNGIMLIMRDVTPQRSPPKTTAAPDAGDAHIAALSNTNGGMLNLLESMTDAFFTLNETWCFTYLNHQAEQLLQRSRTDLLGKNVWTSFPEAVNSLSDSEYHRAVDEQRSTAFETFYPPLNAWFEVRAYPIANGLAVYFQDISDRKRIEIERQRTEAALRESEQRFRSVFDTTAVGMTITSPDGSFLQANAAYCQMLGYTETELLAKTCRHIIHPDDFERGQAQLQQLLSGELAAYRLERRYIHKQGHLVWGLLSVAAVRDEQQKTLYVVYQIQDVTDRQQTVIALRQSEQRFRSIFNTTAVNTAITSLDGTFLQANAAYCQTLGYTEAELLTRTFQQVTHPDDVALDLECIQKCLAGEVSCCQIEKRYLHKSGAIVWGLLSVSLVRDLQQQPLYWVAQMQNISDRKQVEAALRESETRLRLALEAARMSTWDWDIQADTVVYAGSLSAGSNVPSGTHNDAYASFLRDVHPDDLAYVERSLKCALEGAAFTLEFRVNWADKTQHWVGSRGQVYFDQQGHPVRMLGVAKDITDRKQAELALHQLNQELEQRVQDRTAKLQQSNQQLQAAIAAHKQTEAALRTSEERFHTIFDHAPIAISLADAYTYQIVEVNQAHHDLLGYSNTELATLTHVDFTHPDNVQQNLEQVRQLLDGTIPCFRMEKRFLKKNGTWIWTTLTATLVRDPNGRAYSMAMIEDITDRKRREAERQQVEDALRLTQFSIDRSADPIWWVEPDGTISYVNDAACRDLGYERSAIVGQRVSTFNPDFQTADWAAHWQEMKERGAFTFETRNQAKSGVVFPVEVTVNYIELNSKEYHCSIVRNITDRKRADDQLKASLKEKEILLKEIHHRVKNNLQTVYSLLNLQANAIQDPQILAPFKDSQHRVKAMALIHEKLYQSESLANINFAEYVHHLVADLIRSYSANPTKIHAQIEIANLDLAVDIVLPCGLIINELISNALKYAFPSDRSGTIQVCFSLSMTNHFRLVVADNGVSIPESIALRSDATNSTTLGLQLVQAFVQQLRGTIALDRTFGSSFEISFPNPA